MGQFDFSSNPLSTLIPSASSWSPPNYQQAMQMSLQQPSFQNKGWNLWQQKERDLDFEQWDYNRIMRGKKTEPFYAPTTPEGIDPNSNPFSTFEPYSDDSTAPMPNYAQKLNTDIGNSANRMALKAGMATQNSDNPEITLAGKALADGAISGAAGVSTVTPTTESGGYGLAQFGQDMFKSAMPMMGSMIFGGGTPFQNSGINLGAWNMGMNMANNLFTGIFGEKSEYSGRKGSVARGIDTAYDTVMNVAGMIPGGQALALAMGARKLMSNVANKLGAGTDGMTTFDSIMGSSLFQLTPLGLINGIGGRKTISITKDNQAFEKVGSSYTGTNQFVDKMIENSNKKYGLFSNRGRRKMNRQIREARRQQEVVADISNEATDRFNIQDSMAAINGNRRAFNMQGGYNQQDVRVGKHGMNLQLMQRAKEITKKYQEGGPTVDWYNSNDPEAIAFKREHRLVQTQPFAKYVKRRAPYKDVPIHKDGGTFVERAFSEIEPIELFQNGGKTRTLEELIAYAKEKNPRFIQRLSEPPRGIDFIDDNGIPARGSHYMVWGEDDEGNAIAYPRIQEVDGELKLFNNKDAYHRAIENNNILVMTPAEAEIFFAKDPKYGTAYKKGWPEFFNKFDSSEKDSKQKSNEITKHKQGGKTEDAQEPEETSKIEETTQQNVIPEGALHARKHNMELEGITKKGIPVVSEDENGNIEQHAEIEREEIILIKSVTESLEKLQKQYYKEDTTQKEKDELALEAGKLLVQQILYNTQDNANLINRV